MRKSGWDKFKTKEKELKEIIIPCEKCGGNRWKTVKGARGEDNAVYSCRVIKYLNKRLIQICNNVREVPNVKLEI